MGSEALAAPHNSRHCGIPAAIVALPAPADSVSFRCPPAQTVSFRASGSPGHHNELRSPATTSKNKTDVFPTKKRNNNKNPKAITKDYSIVIAELFTTETLHSIPHTAVLFTCIELISSCYTLDCFITTPLHLQKLLRLNSMTQFLKSIGHLLFS